MKLDIHSGDSVDINQATTAAQILASFVQPKGRNLSLAVGEVLTMMRKLGIYLGALLFGMLCTAVASDQRLIADPSVPAATGKAHMDKDRNGNLRLKLEVDHLAKPGALTPAKQSYVVWVQPRGKDPINQGALKVNDNLKGSFEGTVPNQDFEVFVTAEDNAAAQMPTGPKLLRAELQP